MKAKDRNRAWLLVLTALGGVGLSIALTLHYFELRSGSGSFKSSCNIGPAMNCDLVAASPYAELLGRPLSAFAGGWFLALLLISLMSMSRTWRREAVRVGFYLSTLGMGFSIAYLAIMIGILKTYCLYCLGIDLLVLLIFVLMWRSFPTDAREFLKSRADQAQVVRLGLGVLASVVAGVALLSFLNPESFDRAEINTIVVRILTTPPVHVESPAQTPFFEIGKETTPEGQPLIRIVEFSDFQCPYCRIGALSLNSVLMRYAVGDHAPKIRIEFRNFPLDQLCNPEMTSTPHPQACEAARAAYCVHQQGGAFEPVYQSLFENQVKFAPGKPLEIAQSTSGVELAKLQGCMESPETHVALSRDLQDAKMLGVHGTPVFYVNGLKIEGVMPAIVWTQLFEHILKGK